MDDVEDDDGFVTLEVEERDYEPVEYASDDSAALVLLGLPAAQSTPATYARPRHSRA